MSATDAGARIAELLASFRLPTLAAEFVPPGEPAKSPVVRIPG